jgi:hypothetical protein
MRFVFENLWVDKICDLVKDILDVKVCLKSFLHIWDVMGGFEKLFEDDGLKLSDVMVFESSLND